MTVDCGEKVVFVAEISSELYKELQRLMAQLDLSAPDMLQGMAAVYRESASLQKMEMLIKRFEDQHPDNLYIPTKVLLQQTQDELNSCIKGFLNTLSPGTFPPPKPPKFLGLMGY